MVGVSKILFSTIPFLRTLLFYRHKQAADCACIYIIYSVCTYRNIIERDAFYKSSFEFLKNRMKRL